MPINLKDSSGTGFTPVSTANPLPVTIAGGGSASITTVGALNSGSITSGFGSIDVGADAISGGAISGTTGTFSGALAQNAGATNGLITLNSDNTTSGFGSLRIRTGASKTAWQISAQNNVDNGLEITPSTAVGGTTFSTPVATFTSTGLSVTGSVTSTGRAYFGGATGSNNGMTEVDFTGASRSGYSLRETDGTSGSSFLIFRKSDNTAIGSVTRVTTTDAVAFNTTSDARLKENVRDFTAADSARIIDGLKPRWFDWKASDENGKGIIGFIAQEEAAVDSALVRMGAVTVGDDDPDTVSKQWAVDSGKLVPVLVAEIKSLRARLSAAGIA